MARIKGATHKGWHWKLVDLVPEEKFEEVAKVMGIKYTGLRKYFFENPITMRSQLVITMAVNKVMKTNYCHRDLFKMVIDKK